MIRFSSKAGADVWMLDPHGHHLLEIIGKDPHAERGIIQLSEMADAAARLHAAIDREPPPPTEPIEDGSDEDEPRVKPEHVSLRQRAFPLLELMERAQKRGDDVLWGW